MTSNATSQPLPTVSEPATPANITGASPESPDLPEAPSNIPTGATPDPEPDPTASTPLNFFQVWYPLSPLEDLDPKRPTSIILLGERFVVWKPGNGSQFRVFRDRCPHRCVPLSEGRVDEKTGHLMCCYHGWQFDETGACRRIPQLENEQILQQQVDNFRVEVFPCQEALGLLWIWPDSTTPELAAQTPLAQASTTDASQGFVWSNMVRELDYDWSTLVENIVDPAHVPVAHHGIQGDRAKARPLAIEVLKSDRSGIQAHIQRGFNSQITYTAPCLVDYRFNIGADKVAGLVVYCIPVAPGKSRLVGLFPRNFAKGVGQLIPRWWEHLYRRHPVLDGDALMLNLQEQVLQQKGGLKQWKQQYKMPAQADRMVLEFRRWLDRYCSDPLPWGPVSTAGVDQPLDRRRLLDHYHSHTEICSSCRTALARFRQLQKVLVAVALILVAVAALLPDAQRLTLGLELVGVALLCGSVWAGITYRVIPKFYFEDYVHADRP
ncbi:MAG: Rieske 2Fe-2S domain-containing protein [Prochlorothrix sp.]